MRYQIKGQPPIRLVDLLKKRRTTLRDFVKNMGISAYSTLVEKCKKMGVSAPEEGQFQEALGGNYSSPQEGLIVLDPPTLTKDTGQKVSVDTFADYALDATESAPSVDVTKL